ncbi:MAG TPA: papain-like cysteine protease family protein, partial [Gemmatimonadales bacterium]|nr:papain-like cysteine protease family protein [Gemmatimonadales bacterium]
MAQERTNWCWAASGQMVMSYLGVRVSQCQQAIRQFSRPGEAPLQCCDPDQCNWTGYPEYSKFGLNEKLETTPPLTWDRLRYQLSVLKNPVAFTWKWKWQSFEHMM